MKVTQHWSAFFIFGVAILILAFGCATKSAPPKTNAPLTNDVPAKLATQVESPVTTTTPVYVPDMSHIGDALPDGLLAWDAMTKTVEIPDGELQAHMSFNLTNISRGQITVVSVHPSCGCTTAQLPPMPWMLAPGTNGQIDLTINLAGKSGTLFKTVNIVTDKGSKTLMMRIGILPPPVRSAMTAAERAHGLMASQADRQAVFKNDCATCHVKPGEGKYGQPLYQAVCAICHEAEHRATMVPDLHAIKTPTNDQFWQIWIAHGKPGSLMPAFSAAQGGPLNDIQIASLAAYLDSAIPSRVPAPPQ
jgi:cytochrome c553